VSDDIVKCDGCGEPGRRRAGHPCPDHWFFIESKVAGSKRGVIHIVWACSETCRDKLWQFGPGAQVIDEHGTTSMRSKRASKEAAQRAASCIRDDSTECDCPCCVGAEDAFSRAGRGRLNVTDTCDRCGCEIDGDYRIAGSPLWCVECAMPASPRVAMSDVDFPKWEFDAVRPDSDPVQFADGYRLHVFRNEGDTLILLAREQVLPEKIRDPRANRVISSKRIWLATHEARWLRDQLNAALGAKL
jgi:hypothetical protein